MGYYTDYCIKIISETPIKIDMIRNIYLNLTQKEPKDYQLFDNLYVIINDTISMHYGEICATLITITENGKHKYIKNEPLKGLDIKSIAFVTTIKYNIKINNFRKMIQKAIPNSKCIAMMQRHNEFGMNTNIFGVRLDKD